MTLENYLEQNARLYGNKTAIVCQGKETTYAELWKLVEAEAAALRQRGVASGQVVPIRTTQTAEFLVSYFAVHLAGAVALPLEKDMPEERFKQVASRYEHFSAPAEVADILFTTGTTGESKGVMISHDTILADAENLIEAQGFSHELVFIISGPLNHIGSLSKVYPVILLGATLYILEGMKSLPDFFQALDYPCQKMATFLVPASIHILLQLGKRQLQTFAQKIDFIETGAAPMPHSDMLELCRVLPQTRLFNTYASTETGIVCTYNYNDGRTIVGCLGPQLKHSQVFITSEGRVACKGRTLMSGYADEPQRTAEVLRDGVVYTADNGRIDAEGMLHLIGRTDDVINIGGYKVAPTEVEDAAYAFAGVKDCICICGKHAVLGSVLRLLVVMEVGQTLQPRALAQHIAARLEGYKVPAQYEQVDSIARTFNGKLNRKFYREEK